MRNHNRNGSSSNKAGYVPVVFSNNEQYFTQRYISDQSQEFPSIIAADFQAKGKVAGKAYTRHMSDHSIAKGVLPTVFPNMLKQTKADIKKYREYEKSLLDDINTSPTPKLERSIIHEPNKVQPKLPKLKPTIKSMPSFKPIHTDLSYLVMNSINTSVVSSANKRKFSPLADESIWVQNNQVNRINKVYEMQKEMHHLQRFKTQFKSDMMISFLQLKIVQVGLNHKKGLRQVNMLIHLPKSSISLKSSQVESQADDIELNTFHYFIPIYDKINNHPELEKEFTIWIDYFLDLLHIKQQAQHVKCFLLDGRELTTLAQVPQFEKFIYINLEGKFSFWNIISEELKLNQKFQIYKYPKLATRIYDLKTREEIIRFFSRRENILPYFFKQSDSNKQKLSMNLGTLQLEAKVDDVETTQAMFDKSIIQMNEREQKSYLGTIQQYINQHKQKYSDKMMYQEETLRNRLRTIKDRRQQNIEMKTSCNSRSPLHLDEEEDIQAGLIHDETMTIDQIKEEAIDKVFVGEAIVFNKKRKISNKIESPFISFSRKDNKKYGEIVKLINLEKIVLEKNIVRQDVLHYLSIFKALMDTDDQKQVKDLQYPTLFISLGQLQRALPYIALHKNKVNTKKLAEVNSRSYNYVDFMEFLDIFTTNFTVTDQELQDADAAE